MKAAICRSLNSPLSIEDVELGPPGKDEVRLNVAACSICHSDLSFMRGDWGRNPPFLLGHEIAGVVETAGQNVTGLTVGDRVVATLIKSCGHCACCEDNLEVLCTTPPPAEGGGISTPEDGAIDVLMNTGGFAEQVVVHQRQCIIIPDEMSFEAASLLGCGVITGYCAATRVGKIKPGESVAVAGVGGVGINAIQAARIAGAETILAIDTDSSKEALFREMGATGYINPLEGDAIKAVHEANNGQGLDIVLVGVGSSRVIENAIGMIRSGGRVVIMGMPASDDLATLDLGVLANDAKSLIGTKMGSAMIREDIPKLIELYQQGEIHLDSLISHRYPFDDINTAIETALKPGSSRVVILFDHEGT